jgi:four helix bundle protein
MDRPTQKNGFDKSQEISNPKKIRPSGGYRRLRSFQAATVVYDATVSFCARFIDKRSRTVDQMVQAARSGRQNIAEGSRASATSTQTELRLVNVARASLDELLLDYEDFLRQRGLRQWEKDDPQAREVREVGKLPQTDRSDRSDPTDRSKKKLPPCPLCGKPLVVRTARQGARADSQFLGCSGYPNCRGTLPLDGSVRSD